MAPPQTLESNQGTKKEMEVDEASKGDSNPPKNNQQKKEGSFLLGSPTFKDLGNGRFRCKVTGHELPAKEKESYAKSKACRIALIDAAIAKKKPPLNMFHQCAIDKSKIVCELTGDRINKSEEHIWKHMTGKRFMNKLEQREMEKVASPVKTEEKSKKSKKSKKLANPGKAATVDDQKIEADNNASQEESIVEEKNDSEELDFWIPPVGERWDFDDGKDRWEASTSLENEMHEDGIENEADKEHDIESEVLSMRTKRLAIAVGPSSFASRKKKIKKASKHSNDS